MEVYASVAQGGQAPATLAWGAGAFLVVGSEGRGVSDSLLQGAKRVSIRTETVESLNAAVAASILIYEACRSRS